MRMAAVSDSSQAEQNGTLLIISYFPNYVYEMESYTQRQQPSKILEEETEDERKKIKKNEKKLLKD